MSNTTSRYGAIRDIAAYCSSDQDSESTLRSILAAAESVLPVASLELLLVEAGDHKSIRSTSNETHVSAPCTSSVLSWVLSHHEAGLYAESDAMLWVVPLGGSLSGGLVCGMDGLTRADKEFLQTVAQQVTVYLQSRQVALSPGSSVRKRIEAVSSIYEISQAVLNTPVEDLLKRVTETAAVVMDAEACSLMLKDVEKPELVIKASHGLSQEIVEGARVQYGEGVAGKVAKTGEPMLINDLSGDPRFARSRVTPRPGIVSSICVPLRDEEGRVHGVLSVRRATPAIPFNEDDVKLFSVFANQAALAISNAHLYSSLKGRVRELSTLYRVSHELSSAYSLDNASEALIRVAAEMIGDSAAMLLLLDGHHKVSVQAAKGIPDDLLDAIHAHIDGKAIAWGRSLREPKCLLVDNPSKWPAALKPISKFIADSFSRVTLIPLIAEDSVIGMLMLAGSAKTMPEQPRIRLMSIAATQAATIIKNASWHKEQMEQKALELTALYELSERISTAGNLQEALDSILDIVRDTVWYDESFIATADYERNVMTVQASRGIANGDHEFDELPLEEDSLISWAVRERKALVSPDIGKDLRFSQPVIRTKTVRSLMAIPLIVHDEVVGVLNVHGYAPNLYTEDNVRVLSVIASQAAALYKELEALSALTSYTDNILRSIAAGVLTLDRDGRVLTWNKSAEDIIGISADDAVGRHFTELVDKIGISDEGKQTILNAVQRVVDTGEKYLGYKQEYHPINKETLYANMSISQLRDHVGEMLGLVIIFEDVTKEVQMEKEMQRISELAAVGQLAASVAHEIRNPLSSIKGAAQYLRKEYPDHDILCEFLDIIVEEVNVLNKITTEFLDFARPTKLNLKEIDINDVIFRTVQFMHLDITKHSVKVEQILAYDAPRILADERLLEQVLRNMVLNAIQAMPNGGTLTLSSHTTDNGVKMVIQDTGVGIPEEIVSQIFTPFFTTRTKGTGLGLSIVHKIIENHGGKIGVRSVPGQGTTFEIDLPVCSEQAQTVMIHADDIAESGDAGLMRRGQPIT